MAALLPELGPRFSNAHPRPRHLKQMSFINDNNPAAVNHRGWNLLLVDGGAGSFFNRNIVIFGNENNSGNNWAAKYSLDDTSWNYSVV